MFVDDLSLLGADTGYGALGLRGNLGYDGRVVAAQGQRYAHAVSAHPPSRVSLQLSGRFLRFQCHIAINDDVTADATHADFAVLADGREVGVAWYVPRGRAAARAVRRRDRRRAARSDRAHDAMGVLPRGLARSAGRRHRRRRGAADVADCLGRTEIAVPAIRPRAGARSRRSSRPASSICSTTCWGRYMRTAAAPSAAIVVFA